MLRLRSHYSNFSCLVEKKEELEDCTLSLSYNLVGVTEMQGVAHKTGLLQ